MSRLPYSYTHALPSLLTFTAPADAVPWRTLQRSEAQLSSVGLLLDLVGSTLVAMLVDVGPPLEDHAARPTLEPLLRVHGVHVVLEGHLAGKGATALWAVQPYSLLGALVLVLWELGRAQQQNSVAVAATPAHMHHSSLVLCSEGHPGHGPCWWHEWGGHVGTAEGFKTGQRGGVGLIGKNTLAGAGIALSPESVGRISKVIFNASWWGMAQTCLWVLKLAALQVTMRFAGP